MRPQLRTRDRGFALLIVLWFLMLLTLIATRLVGDARGDLALARNIVVAAKAEAVADAAVIRAVYALGDPRPEQRWMADGTLRRLALPDGEAAILVENERTKINVNHASRELLSALFAATGADRGAADAIVDAILQRRGGDGAAPPPSGAPNPAAAPTAAVKGRPFVALEELGALPQMNAAIFAAARPYLTPYGESAEPDAKTAPPAVRRALDAVHGASASSVAGQPQAMGGAQAPSFLAIDAPADAASASGAASAIFRIVATAKASGGEFRREAVVKLDPGSAKGYGILAWQALRAAAP